MSTEDAADEAAGPEETAGPTPEERRALFRVVRGEPSDAELVALTVVLAAASSSGGGVAPVRRRDRWSDPVARLRAPLAPGPGAWAGTYLPR